MYNYGKTSQSRLDSCHPLLKEIFEEAIKIMDISIMCGHRPELAQQQAFEAGLSKLQFPESKHNQEPSLAVDAAPYPIDWNDYRFTRLVFKPHNLSIKDVYEGFA